MSLYYNPIVPADCLSDKTADNPARGSLTKCAYQLESIKSQQEANNVVKSNVCKDFVVTVKCDQAQCVVKSIGPYKYHDE